MKGILTPPRLRGSEILDDPSVDPRIMRRSLKDVSRANALFGGREAVVAEIRDALPFLPPSASLLDIGTGVADIPLAARDAAAKAGVRITTTGLDSAEELCQPARHRLDHFVCGSALALPFATSSFDLVVCSQVLHHFAGDDASLFLREANRVARFRVIVSDLRRSWIAAAGLWIASFPLFFHPVSRHDGVVSVMRGFTAVELSELISDTTGATPRVKLRRGFRVTASWVPAHP